MLMDAVFVYFLLCRVALPAINIKVNFYFWKRIRDMSVSDVHNNINEITRPIFSKNWYEWENKHISETYNYFISLDAN